MSGAWRGMNSGSGIEAGGLMKGMRRFMIGREGFSLVEMMVSLVILLFVAMAMTQTALINIEANTRNVLRAEATRITSEELDNMRTVPFDDLMPVYNGTSQVKTRKIRQLDAAFTVNRFMDDLSQDFYRINVRTDWTWKSVAYNTTMSTTRKK